MKRYISIVITLLLILQAALPMFVYASDDFEVYVNNSKVSLVYDEKLKDELFPIKELLAKFGVYISFDEEKQAYVGNISEAELEVPLSGNVAHYDLVPIELDKALEAVDGDVLVELRFIDMLYGVDYTMGENYINFKINLIKDEENEADKAAFDAEKYLASLTPKAINISSNSLPDAAISDPTLIAKRVVEVTDAPGFTTAVEIDNLIDKPRLNYEAQITLPIENSVSANDVLVFTFWARKISCVDESGYAEMNTVYETKGSTWRKHHTATEKIGDKWTKFQYVFPAKHNLTSGGAQIGFRIGFRLQTIQVGGVSVVNYGKDADLNLLAPDKIIPTTYYGREEGALWREEALRRIEKYRKNDITFKVTDESGNPISDAKVTANMTRSEFLWGNAANQQKMFEAGKTGINYKNVQNKDFNSATCETGMKSAGYEATNCVDLVNFARENNKYFRFHAILWDNVHLWPKEIQETTTDPTQQQLIDASLRHASKMSYFFGDAITEIDVLNEPLNNNIARNKYGSQFIAEIFKVTRKLFPNARLFVNETGISGSDANSASIQKLKDIVEEIIDQGGPVEGIGIQNHAQDFIYPQKFYNAIDYVAENLKYIAITEYDYLSGLANTSDALSAEADYLRDSIILAYSHPKMTSFTMWGFTDNGHWRANAPLYTAHYNPKPAYEYWDKYVHGEWFTQADSVTDQNGEAVIRGHRGEYDIIVDAYGKTAKTTLKLTKDGVNTITAVVKADGIEIKSSEEVVLNTTPNTILNDAFLNNEKAENYYLELFENNGTSIVNTSDEDVSFLFDKENTSPLALDKNASAVLTLNEATNNGYVNIRATDGEEALILIEVQNENGEWTKVYAGETKNSCGSFYFENQGVTKIRVSGLVDTPAMINYITVSQEGGF